MKQKRCVVKASVAPVATGSKVLLADVRELILSARQTVARGVNAALVLLYWKIGERIRKDILREKRAEYGQKIFSTRICLAERGHSCPQQLPNASVGRFATASPRSPLLRTGMSALRAKHIPRHCRENWWRSLVGGSRSRTCSGWRSSRRHFLMERFSRHCRENWAGRILWSFCRSRSIYSAISTRKCAASSDGACGCCAAKLAGCFMSGRRCRENRQS